MRALKDVAFDTELFQRALNEKVTGVSLLRAVTPASVQGQFYRMARGGARLSSYKFCYTAPKPPRSRIDPVRLDFEVKPESQPPTNIHVLIGRNGVGKTRLLNGMTRALVGAEGEEEDVGSFDGDTEDLIDERLFATRLFPRPTRPRSLHPPAGDFEPRLGSGSVTAHHNAAFIGL